MNIAAEIEKLHALYESGALTEAEFTQAKAKLLERLNQTEGAAASPTHQTLQVNHLRRAKNDAWIGGVCGGLAQWTGIESWVWRALFLFFACFLGTGFLVYLLAWIFIPLED